MSELEQMYREVILDHYKSPRGHGLLEHPDAQAEGQNPLCGDEVTISVRFGEDGETIEAVGFDGRGCAISQAATSMLTELVKGRTATDVAALPKEELLEEIGIPLTPIRLKCAILGLGVLKVALHKAKGTPLPGRVAEPGRRPAVRLVAKIDVAPLGEFGPGSAKIVTLGWTSIGVYNCNGKLYALEDRCSHDDGPLCEGEWDQDLCRVDLPAARLRASTSRPARRSRCPPTSRSRPIPSASRTGRARWKSHRALLGDGRRAVQRLPRRGVGPPGPRRARALRAALPRGLPVGALVADDPAQAGGVPGGVRGLRPRAGRGASASATSRGCSPTPRSSATAARSRRRSRTRGRPSRCARRSRCTSSSGRAAPERHDAPRHARRTGTARPPSRRRSPSG